MKIQKYAAAFFVLLLLTALSCKKKQDDTTTSNNGKGVNNLSVDTARLATVTFYTGSNITKNYRITYAAGKVDSIVYGSPSPTAVFKFRYYNGYYEIEVMGAVQHVDENIYGLMSCYYIKGSIDSLKFEYDANRRLTTIVQVHGSYTTTHGTYYPLSTQRFTYVWNSVNNIESISTDSSNGYQAIWPYKYDPLKYGQVGDALRIGEFLTYGRTYLNTKDVPIAVHNANGYYGPGSPGIEYGYDYDALGRIVNAYTLPIVVDTEGYRCTYY